MLRRVEYETPNVIDLGESALSAPKRRDDDGAEPPIPSGDKDDIRARASLLLEQTTRQGGSYKPNLSSFRGTKILHINPQEDIALVGAEDEFDADPELPVHDHLPSVEQARQFAAAILDESEKQGSRRNIFGKRPKSPIRVDDVFEDESSTMSSMKFARNQMEFARNQLSRNRICCRFLVVVSFAAMVIILSLTIVSVYFSDNVKSERMVDAVTLLSEAGISNRDSLASTMSPQYKAAQWIANVDELRLSIPSSPLRSDEHFEFVQRYILAVLFYSLGGENWDNRLKFLTGIHECGWFHPVPDESGEVYAVGVSCDDELHVNTILIPNNNVRGTLPQEVQHLTKLTFLSLKHNQLSGPIPAALKNLTMLNYLDLKYNELAGSLPHFLGNQLSHLKVLGLSNNQFTGSIPTSLAKLSRLVTLAVDDNLLTGDLAPVASLKHLEYFYAENNSFDGHLDGDLFDHLERLIELDLSGNDLKASAIPEKIFALPDLKALDLSHNKIKGTIPSVTHTNEMLTFLSLRGNHIHGSIPHELKNLEALTHLDLEDNKLSGAVPDNVFRYWDLTDLFLGKNKFDAWSLPSSMANMTSLKELSLDNAGLVGTIPSFVTSEAFKHLRLLDLRHNALAGSLPTNGWEKLHKLTVLLLNDNVLTGPIPAGLASLSKLDAVALHHNGFIADAGGLCRSGDLALDVLTTDCGAITCECCSECCDSEDCFAIIGWEDLEFTNARWEHHFKRANYSFNPEILVNNHQSGAF